MAEPLKNLVDQTVVQEIADRVAAAAPDFDPANFVTDVMVELPDLELKPRIAAIAGRLRAGLPDDYRAALETVVAVAKQEPPISGWAAWPLCTFVEIFGVADPQVSLPAMEHLTKRASCEFAIRPFLRDHWEAAYATLLAFTDHSDEAVRRLPSEGSRPRLPWGARVARLTEDPAPGLALLERLRHDPSEMVRRSVANHLNDISRDHPAAAVATVERWKREPTTDPKMISHALRTLVKQGDPAALQILGFTAEPAIQVIEFAVAPARVEMGDRIELKATLRSSSESTQKLVVDFVVHHITASGKTSPKVFKWTTVDLQPGETVELTKRRRIHMATTRTYYSGRHAVELQVAGSIAAAGYFDVVV
jgi:3-methyladenine DNA glycosylase AlkC